ncbi:MAG TPA: hypothetical protein VNQ99_05085 [Xanthobacteraceae bacterium]|nr:hypothetical protein [Xanthobacteraceae bacterium]
MAKLTAAFGSSHSVMLTCQLEDWQRGFKVFDLKGRYFDRQGEPKSYEELLALAPPNAADLVTDEAIAKRYHSVRDAIARMKADVLAANLDVLIICGDDQHEFFSDDLMPPFVIYYGDTILNPQRKPVAEGPEAWYKRAQSLRQEEHGDVHYPVRSDMALHFITGLTDMGFDVTSMKKTPPDQYEGHAFSFIHRFYMNVEKPVPVIPIMLNTYYPPNPPTPARCIQIGQALRQQIESFPEDLKVGFMASGGLSHFQAEEDLDDAVIDALRRNDLDFLSKLSVKRLQAGSSEIRNWLVLAGCVGTDFELDWVSYNPGYRTPALTGTGLGFATWKPKAAAASKAA